MGFFSSKYKTYVGTSVMRVIEDKLLPNSVRSGSARALFQSEDLTDHILEDLVTGVGVKADRMYEYAKRSYTHGLPSGKIFASAQGMTEVTAVLEAMEGAPVLLEYLEYGPPNSLHVGWVQLMSEYGYNPATNQLDTLTASTGKPVFLHDMVVVVPTTALATMAPEVLDQWGTPPSSGVSPSRPLMTPVTSALRGHTPVITDPQATDDYVRVEYVWAAKETDLSAEAFTEVSVVKHGFAIIPLTESLADSRAEYFQVKYTVNGVTKYWMYRVGSGTHPTLDALMDVPPPVSGAFFPFTYFRYNKRSEIEDTSTAAYKTSKRLVKYLGIDYDDLSASIDENPDIADVQSAMMVMAVPANTENELERRYLFSFFDSLYYSQGSNLRSPIEGRLQGLNDGSFFASVGRKQHALVIQDKRFKMVLGNGGIYKRRVVGNFGAIGTHTSGTSSETFQVERTDADSGQPYLEPQTTKYHYYRKQISDVLYDELIVVNLRTLFYVIDNYVSVGDAADTFLLIPLDRTITRQYSLMDREVLYARSLHYVFNSVQVVKVRWYESGFFQFLILVVAVVISAISLQPQIAAAVAAGTTAAYITLAIVLLEQLLIGLVIGAALKLFVKLVGIKLAFVIALIAAAYGMTQALEAGSLAGAPWAQELLQISSGLSKAIGENLKDMFGDLLGEFQTLDLLKDEATKKLEAANDLLNTKNYLSPFVIFGESPDDFYNRTVHSGNIGMNGISAISSYVDIALRLPEINDTIGENNYV